MIYNIIPQKIPQERRAEINDKILFDIDTGKKQIPAETIFNCYTGRGSLHGLKQEDFENYHQYAEAKKEIEMGQFFTPHEICREMIELIRPEPTEMVMDMCCGMGNFFNHLPNQFNAYGFDVDINAVKVAKELYPDANIQTQDIRQYTPTDLFDIIIGNPPFNIDFDGSLSQFYYCNKAYWALRPGGLFMFIVPCSFLASEFWDRSKVNAMNRDFSFIGQTKLDPNAFASVGVTAFNTKIMVFMRDSHNIDKTPYSAETFLTKEELAIKITEARKVKNDLRIQIMRETSQLTLAEEQAFQYKVNKYLYELKAHKKLNRHYDKAQALITKFRNQRPPLDCTEEEKKEWEKRKLTHKKVLSTIYRYIKKQNYVPRKEIALVKTNYGFRLKQYSPNLLNGVKKQYSSMNNLLLGIDTLPEPKAMTPALREQYRTAQKLIERKRKSFILHETPILELERDPAIDEYIDKLTFIKKDNIICQFNELQKHDLGLVMQRRYNLLNWQQGSGKTAVAYHYAKYLLNNKKVKNVIITAPPIAIEWTWKNFMKWNNEKFIILKKPADVDKITEGAFILISNMQMGKFDRRLTKFLKRINNKACCVDDESDDKTNHLAQRTKDGIKLLRRLKYKFLMTGTTTRNYISELYSQLELLYNNSVHFLCKCQIRYYEDPGDGIKPKDNLDNYLKPFPARGGASLFKSCFNPSKSSVLGIKKQNQDIYNKEALAPLIKKTILTRKFREIAGDKYQILTHTVTPTEVEKEYYQTLFSRYKELYYQCFQRSESSWERYNEKADRRKQAQLEITQQIQLLIKACSVPHLMPEYPGDDLPAKILYIERLLKTIPDKVIIGCTNRDAQKMYTKYLTEKFPNRPVFGFDGEVSFKQRQKIIQQFEDTEDGIAVVTQKSIRSSVNIPSCNEIIAESLPWNIPSLEQFFFRPIRFDSEGFTRVHLVTYAQSIEQNILALVLVKERLNDFIKSGEVTMESEIFETYDIDPEIINSSLSIEKDEKGLKLAWGQQKVS